MGEYADRAVAREQTESARRMMREQAAKTEEQRKAEGREEAARNQAVRDARDTALAEGLAAVAGPALEVGLVVEREGKSLVAKRGVSERGRWWPDRRPTIRGRSLPCCTASEWFERLLR